MFSIFGFTVLITLFFLRKEFSQKKHGEVCFRDYCFSVDLAVTPKEKLKGLSYKEKLKDREGLLFVFDKEDIYPFWMKDTLIPLDIIWIDNENKVVYIKENAQPCLKDNCSHIIPNRKAKYVLEIAAGTVKQLGTEIGDQVIINF